MGNTNQLGFRRTSSRVYRSALPHWINKERLLAWDPPASTLKLEDTPQHIRTITSLNPNNQTNTSLVVQLPAIADGKLWVIDFLSAASGTDIDPIVATPSGWNLRSTGNDTGLNATYLHVFWRIKQTGDPDSVTITWTTAGQAGAIASGYRNTDATTPIPDINIEGKGSADASMDVALTTTVAALLRAGFGNRSAYTYTIQDGDARRGEFRNSSANTLLAFDSGKMLPAAAYTKTGTGSGTSGVGIEYAYSIQPVVVAGTTVVGDELQAIWNDNAVVSDTLQTIWNLRAIVNDSLQTIWNEYVTVNDSLQTIWNDYAVVNKNLQTIWNLNAILGDTVQIVWNDNATVNDNLQAIWNNLTSVNDSLQVIWNDAFALQDTLDLVWNVEVTGVTPVGDELQLIWNMSAAASDTLQSIWNTNAPVADTLQVVWNDRAPVADTMQAIWNDRANVFDTLQIVWGDLASVSDTLQSIWNVSLSVSDTIQLLWNDLTNVQDSLELIWNALGILSVSTDLTLVWNITVSWTEDGQTVTLWTEDGELLGTYIEDVIVPVTFTETPDTSPSIWTEDIPVDIPWTE